MLLRLDMETAVHTPNPMFPQLLAAADPKVMVGLGAVLATVKCCLGARSTCGKSHQSVLVAVSTFTEPEFLGKAVQM